MGQGQESEQDLAWRLMHDMQTLSMLLWDRYETEFMARHLDEEERWKAIRVDNDTQEYPF